MNLIKVIKFKETVFFLNVHTKLKKEKKNTISKFLSVCACTRYVFIFLAYINVIFIFLRHSRGFRDYSPFPHKLSVGSRERKHHCRDSAKESTCEILSNIIRRAVRIGIEYSFITRREGNGSFYFYSIYTICPPSRKVFI